MRFVLRICALIVALILPIQGVTGAASIPLVPLTFGLTGDQAVATLLSAFYNDGHWRNCDEAYCRETNSDWGADSATYTLYLRWRTNHDAWIPSVMTALLDTAPLYPNPCDSSQTCGTWSDTPAWDAVAYMREYEVLGKDPRALQRAQAAFRFVAQSRAFAQGACPSILYELPRSGLNDVKTLETDGNAIKAALLLYGATRQISYLRSAMVRYAAARQYYLDPHVPLYTVHVLDDGFQCVQVPHRFFASVNGDMIFNGLVLWHATGIRTYLNNALATARAVDENLADARGIFSDVQGENDVVEPLVESMYDLATQENQQFARAWILRNAEAALSARSSNGTFKRFFDGPAQGAATSLWESNGGLALEIAAGALAPRRMIPRVDTWNGGHVVGPAIVTLPATVSFAGSGIALVGTMGRRCQGAHVHVMIDGAETFDRTGLWQNKSMPDGRTTAVLFAWRWPHPGVHTISLQPGNNAVEGPVDIQSYVIP
jgi:hypothetical protein